MSTLFRPRMAYRHTPAEQALKHWHRLCARMSDIPTILRQDAFEIAALLFFVTVGAGIAGAH